MNFTFGATLLLQLISQPLLAQTSSIVNVGDRVRITASAIRVTNKIAVVRGISGDTLLLRSPSGEKQNWMLEQKHLQSVEVLRPLKGDLAMAGVFLGLVSGGVLSGAAGYFATQCSCDDSGIGILLAVPGAVGGGVLGGLIGKSIKTDGWQLVALPVRVSVAVPGGRQMRVRASIAFH